jgi:hypothetical protein
MPRVQLAITIAAHFVIKEKFKGLILQQFFKASLFQDKYSENVQRLESGMVV